MRTAYRLMFLLALLPGVAPAQTVLENDLDWRDRISAALNHSLDRVTVLKPVKSASDEMKIVGRQGVWAFTLEFPRSPRDRQLPVEGYFRVYGLEKETLKVPPLRTKGPNAWQKLMPEPATGAAIWVRQRSDGKEVRIRCRVGQVALELKVLDLGTARGGLEGVITGFRRFFRNAAVLGVFDPVAYPFLDRVFLDRRLRPHGVRPLLTDKQRSKSLSKAYGELMSHVGFYKDLIGELAKRGVQLQQLKETVDRADRFLAGLDTCGRVLSTMKNKGPQTDLYFWKDVFDTDWKDLRHALREGLLSEKGLTRLHAQVMEKMPENNAFRTSISSSLKKAIARARASRAEVWDITGRLGRLMERWEKLRKFNPAGTKLAGALRHGRLRSYAKEVWFGTKANPADHLGRAFFFMSLINAGVSTYQATQEGKHVAEAGAIAGTDLAIDMAIGAFPPAALLELACVVTVNAYEYWTDPKGWSKRGPTSKTPSGMLKAAKNLLLQKVADGAQWLGEASIDVPLLRNEAVGQSETLLRSIPEARILGSLRKVEAKLEEVEPTFPSVGQERRLMRIRQRVRVLLRARRELAAKDRGR